MENDPIRSTSNFSWKNEMWRIHLQSEQFYFRFKPSLNQQEVNQHEALPRTYPNLQNPGFKTFYPHSNRIRSWPTFWGIPDGICSMQNWDASNQFRCLEGLYYRHTRASFIFIPELVICKRSSWGVFKLRRELWSYSICSSMTMKIRKNRKNRLVKKNRNKFMTNTLLSSTTPK